MHANGKRSPGTTFSSGYVGSGATRPIFHKCDDPIRGHVFCSFLALVLLKKLQDRLTEHGFGDVEWVRLRDDLNELQEFRLELSDKHFPVRTAPTGEANKALKATAVALGPAVQRIQ